MAQEYQFICDGCNAVLHGKMAGKHIRESYLKVRGTMVLELEDKDAKQSEHIFLTRPPSEEVAFCLKKGMPCIEAYITRRRESYNFRKREMLKAEAEGRPYKEDDGLEPGDARSFTVGNPHHQRKY